MYDGYKFPFPDKLYNIPEALAYFRPDDDLQNRIIELLMRRYPGIFTQYVWISEDYLAQEAGVKRKGNIRDPDRVG